MPNRHVLYIIPNYAFGQALFDMFLNQKYGEICDEGNAQACRLYKENYTSVWEPGVGIQAVYLFFGGIVWFLLLLLGEAGIFPRREPRAFRSPAREEEADVAAERQRVLSNTKKDDCLVVQGLTKVYRKKGSRGRFTAVDNLTFGVPAGQCFGLLGVNGAGKTTTFNALTGEIPMTKGDITAAGYDLRHHSSKARQHMGYCPQYDALIGLLVRMERWGAAREGLARCRTAADLLLCNLCGSISIDGTRTPGNLCASSRHPGGRGRHDGSGSHTPSRPWHVCRQASSHLQWWQQAQAEYSYCASGWTKAGAPG